MRRGIHIDTCRCTEVDRNEVVAMITGLQGRKAII